MQKETENKPTNSAKELNFSQNWVNWVRSCPSDKIREVKEAIKAIISKIDAEEVSDHVFNNYFYKRVELPARFRAAIIEYAARFDQNRNLVLDFTFSKEKSVA